MRDEPALFSVGAMETQLLGDESAAAEGFARHHAIVCGTVLEPALLAVLMKICGRAQFVSDDVAGLGHREVETPTRAGGALTLALKRANLLRWIERVTGCGTLRSVSGRVVQTRPNVHDRLLWHDDLQEPWRRLAITINLSERSYDGGMFELRRAGSDTVLTQHAHVGPGSALIFDVARGLEHRLLPITSGGPRRVYAGWFLTREEP
jgi:hypothetical protein